MSENFDAGAFVVSGTKSSSVSAGLTTLIAVAPCELDVSSIQVYATTGGTTASTFNIKVTPPVTPPVYARTYNYNYATAKNYQISSVTNDATYASSAYSSATLTFTTVGSHNLSVGDVVTITGFSFAPYNLKDATVASVNQSSGTFTIKYPEKVATDVHLSGAIPGNYAYFSYPGTGTVATYNSTTIPHGLKTGDKVTISNLTTATGYHVTAAAVTVKDAFSFTYPVASGGTFSGSGNAIIVPTIVAPTGNSAIQPVVTKGQVVDAVQLVTDATDYNKAADYKKGTAYYAYVSDLILPAVASSTAAGINFPAATNLGNADGRVAGKIPTGSKVELEIVVAGTSLADLDYGVEFKKK